MGFKLFWSICILHTNEVPLPHFITSNGPKSSDSDFTGPMSRLLSKVNQMQYNTEFRVCQGVRT